MRIMTACAAMLALGAATPALAQEKPANMQVTPPAKTTPAPAPAAPAAAADASATTGFRAGLPVKDAQGIAVGTLAAVIKTPDGGTTYKVTVDGRNVNLPGSALTLNPTGTEAISTMTKAQITASTAPPA